MSAAYAKISIQTAYLKCYHPTEFMAALLSISEGKKDKNKKSKNVNYIPICEEMGIQILPPDINESKSDWTPIIEIQRDEQGNEFQKGYIRYGIGSIAGVRNAAVDNIIMNQPYDSVDMLIESTDSSKVNKTKVINLIKAGCFDSINKNRNALLNEYGKRIGENLEVKETTTKTDIIQYERETLGISVTIKSRWMTIPDGKANIQFTGILQEIDPFVSQKGQEHCRIKIETNEDTISGIIFNRNWMNLKDQLIVGAKVVVKGKKNNDSLQVNSVAQG